MGKSCEVKGNPKLQFFCSCQTRLAESGPLKESQMSFSSELLTEKEASHRTIDEFLQQKKKEEKRVLGFNSWNLNSSSSI